jgi:hypothetical protein
MSEEIKSTMLRTAQNLKRLGLERGLDPVFTDELHAAALAADTGRFLDGIGCVLSALKERRESASEAAA